MAGDAPTSAPAQDAAASSVGVRYFWCCFYGAGIIGSLVCYGVLQERIMTVTYDQQMFTWTLFLVFCNRLAAVIFAGCMAVGKRESLTTPVPIWKYAVVSLSNVAATSCQYEALKYVIFPVQMLAKSFKMMPVMVWGMIISAKSYTCVDWAVAAGVTFGVTEFLLTGPTKAHHSQGSSAYGYGLLMMFLAFDGLTSTLQEKLFKEYSVSKYNQMMYVNTVSSFVSIGALATSGGFGAALRFCSAHTAFVIDATLLSASAVTGQWFIYSQVKEFGALIFAATMNIRQVVSILLSNYRFGHALSHLQWLGLVVVFGALFYKPIRELLSQLSPADERTALLEKKADGDRLGPIDEEKGDEKATAQRSKTR